MVCTNLIVNFFGSHLPSVWHDADGWCQDVIDAAMLNMTSEAASQVLERAQQGPATGWRFPGFAQHYQDYEPCTRIVACVAGSQLRLVCVCGVALDHFSFMRTAMHYMLISPLDDANQTVQLFPTWPVTEWDVSFKLWAPLNTTIEASCVGGELQYLIVTPAERAQDVTVLNCKSKSKSE
jgi:hypothetical protein